MKNNKTMMHTRGNPSPSTAGPMPPQLLHSTDISSKRYAGAPTRLSRARSIPFLPALLRMVANGDVLFDDGKLILENPDSFASRVLPRFFRHANLSSFRRQLNNFGFQKITVKDRIECHVFYNDELKGQHPEAILDLHRRSSTAKSPAKAIRKKRQFSKHDMVQPKDASGLSSSSIPSISLEEQAEMAKDFSDVTQRGVPGPMTRETTLLRSEYEGNPPPEKKSKRYPCREDLRRSTTAIADDVIIRDDPAVWNLPSGDEPLQPFVTLSPPQATAKITICDSLSPVDDRVRFGFRGWQSPLCDKGKNDEGQVEADDSRAGVLVAYGSAYDDEEVRPVSPTPREFDEDCWNGKEETGSGDLEHQVDAVVQSDFEGGRGKEVASTILQQSKDVYDDTRMSSTELDHNEGDQVFPTLGDDRAFSEDSDESDEAAAAASTAVATTYPSGENPLSASHSFFSVGGLFRPSFRYEDADFGGKNFGDSILGECRVVDGEEDWNPFYDVTITDGFPTVRRRYSTGAEPEVCMSDRTNDACETACAQYKSSNSSTQAGQGVFLDSDLRVMTRNKCGATWSPELLSKTSSPLPPCRPTIPWVSSRVGR